MWPTAAYLAQFGKQCLQESEAFLYDDDSWESRRQHFGGKIWGTAVLRMGLECINEPRDYRLKTNRGQSSFLGPDKWNGKCFLNEAGLPYNWPVLKQSDDALPSHGLYRPLIKEAVAQVPSYLYDFVEKLTPSQVEWFAIFIGISDWCGCNAQPQSQALTGSKYFDILRPRKKLQPTDAPVRILQDQLGFIEPPVATRCGFPFMRTGYGKYLWDNRGILQVSARIDNCQRGLGLDGQEYNIAHSSETQRDVIEHGQHVGIISDEGLGGEGNTNKDSAEDTDKLSLGRSERIFDFHRDLERIQLRYQLTNIDAQHAHLEHSLSFMGCVTESVRSEIADFCYVEGDGKDDMWFATLPRRSIPICISQQLWGCLLELIDDQFMEHPEMFNSTIQERLLWECQNGVHAVLQQFEEERHKGVQYRVEAMLLLLLGFPSLRVEHSKEVLVLKDNSVARVFFRISPVAGPQPFKVLITACRTSPLIYLEVVVDGDEKFPLDEPNVLFKWQDWRDAFEGRLHGRREWQRNHYMNHVRVHRVNTNISRGVVSKNISSADAERTALVWEGWWPFRAGMALFELKHSSLIIVGDQMPSESHRWDEIPSTVHRVRSTKYGAAVAYEKASISDLSDASVHLDAILKLNSSLVPTRNQSSSPDPPPLWNMMAAGKRQKYSRSSPSGSKTSTNPSQLSIGDLSDDEDNVSNDVELSSVVSPSSSPKWSQDNVFKALGRHEVQFVNFVPNPTPIANSNLGDADALMGRVQEQDPSAMHDLARGVLTGTGAYRKNRPKALLLMERAIVLGRRIEAVEMFVNSILEHEKNQIETNPQKLEDDVDRALRAVEMMWRDIGARHLLAFENGKAKLIRKSENKQEETTRMKKLTKLHLKLIKVRRTGDLMRYLANRLATWGKSDTEREAATILYESAILANRDLKAMHELALISAKQDIKFAVQLYERVETLSARRATSEQQQQQETGGSRERATFAGRHQQIVTDGWGFSVGELGDGEDWRRDRLRGGTRDAAFEIVSDAGVALRGGERIAGK
ncbi:hypothetical protein FGB62_85g17 [Gracilaria domingensis]|nr:hypothetical protein FGB62_85g17 [Gracilaria domingensis]